VALLRITSAYCARNTAGIHTLWNRSSELLQHASNAHCDLLNRKRIRIRHWWNAEAARCDVFEALRNQRMSTFLAAARRGRTCSNSVFIRVMASVSRCSTSALSTALCYGAQYFRRPYVLKRASSPESSLEARPRGDEAREPQPSIPLQDS
jgi:hypothetical protein